MRRLWHLACTARELRLRTGHARIERYSACLRFGVQGAGVGSVEARPRLTPAACRSRCSVCTRPPRASRYRCATEYVKYAHESSVNKNKSARIQTQDTAQKSSCCFPHMYVKVYIIRLGVSETPRIVELRRLASQIQPQPTHPSVHRADSERATMAAVH